MDWILTTLQVPDSRRMVRKGKEWVYRYIITGVMGKGIIPMLKVTLVAFMVDLGGSRAGGCDDKYTLHWQNGRLD